MILLYNVYLTDVPVTGTQWLNLGVYYDRGNLSTPSKVDILLYSLSSFSVIKWKKVILNIELDYNYYTK